MKKIEDKNTRYYIEIDLKTMKIINYDYDQKEKFDLNRLNKGPTQLIFLTKGQYNKFVGRLAE